MLCGWWGGRSGESVSQGLLHLLVDGFGVVALGGGLSLVAQDVLYLLHAQAALVEQCGAGVACQMPVQVLADGGELCHLPQVFVSFFVVAYGGQLLGRLVALQQAGGLAAEEGVEGYAQAVACLVLAYHEQLSAEACGAEASEVAPPESGVAAEEEGVADVAQVPVGNRRLFQLLQFLHGEVLAACFHLWYAYASEGVAVVAYDVALDGLADQASQCFHADDDGVLAQVLLRSHPVLPALQQVVVDVAQPQSRRKGFDAGGQGAVEALGRLLACRGRDDRGHPLADGCRRCQVVAVGVDEPVGRRLLSGVGHLVFQFHEPSECAS